MFSKVHFRSLLIFGTVITVAFSLIGTVWVQVKMGKVDRLDSAARNATEYALTLEHARYEAAQVQQYLTDASLTKEEDSLKEAKAAFDGLNKLLIAAVPLRPASEGKLMELRQSAEATYQVGLEMTNAYWKDGKEAGDLIMKRAKTGLDDRSEELSKLLSVQVEEARGARAEQARALSIETSAARAASLLTSLVLISAVFFLMFLVWGRVKPLAGVTSNIGSSSASLANSVNQLVTASQNMMAMVSQQVSAIQETSAALDEITAMVNRSAERSDEVRKATQQSQKTAGEGKQRFDELIEAMNSLRSANKESGGELDKSNERISEIVSIIKRVSEKTRVINDIVFQTKLLSFNASVEAARAGENGKGFSVVAEEVGNLAQMSGQAAKEINALLDSSMEQVTNTVTENRQSVEKMMAVSSNMLERGIKMTQECQKSLDAILRASLEVGVMVDEISSGSQESAKGVSEVSGAIQEINQAATVTSNSAQVCEGAAKSLTAEVEMLRLTASQLSRTVQGKAWISKFQWKEDYAIGVTHMDDEHKVLIVKINALADALDRNSHQELKLCFRDLAAYAKEHFDHEEKYHHQIQYPDYEAHHRIHRGLLEQVTELGKQVEANTVDAEKLMNFLNDWLLKHILGVDMKYARYSRGERTPALVMLQHKLKEVPTAA